MKNLKSKIFVLTLLLFSVFHFPFSVYAQVRPVYDRGALGLGQLLKRLNNTKSVMMIGAHPDDEDSALLAFLARGENARTAYLSLTRGDGGQNIIGKELFEPLGVIRTEELLQARRLDGAEQFFTRAFDYGFSKTLAEAKEKWDEKIILCDAVRAIRTFRPQVVISRWQGTKADGHGQHQFSGYISPLAVKAAADANQCKDAGAPWQVLKFYVGQNSQNKAEPTLKINTGEYDFLLGRSYYEIAAEGRSQHKSQEQGALELKGEQYSNLNLVESVLPKRVENEKSIFDGIDTSFHGIWFKSNEKVSGELINYVRDWHEQMSIGAGDFKPEKTYLLVPDLLANLKTAEEIRRRFPETVSNNAVKFLIETKKHQLTEAVKLASGLQIDALVNQETVTQGETFKVAVKVFHPNQPNVKIKKIKLNAPKGWRISPTGMPINNSPSERLSRGAADESKFFSVEVSNDARLTEPYFLENERENFLYKTDGIRNEPFQKPLAEAEVAAEVGGTEITFYQPVEYRFADPIRGEIRRNLNIVPKFSLSLDRNLLIVSQRSTPQTKRITLNVKNNSSQKISETGTAELKLPKGWQAKSSFGMFQPNKKGENFSLAFDIIIPANTKVGDYKIEAFATAGGEIFTQTMNEIAYPHIQTHRFYTAAETKVKVFDLKTAPVKIGYIMGSGDEVPEAIRQMGLPVESLNENDLTNGDLSKYDTIVVGVRAFQVRQDLVSNNPRILDFVKNGGTLVVQYQRPDYVKQNLAPFTASMEDKQKTTAGTTSRVVDENAKVTILQPAHPVFNLPNEINEADFNGWLQERNLYNFVSFDERYTPLLESHDAGEQENKGGMLIAKVGKGNYIYTSYSFFRQLPAGNPGAYRLFANLLSLPKAKL